MTPKSAGVQALFFGDFLLCQQKKVTRPPGRNPARCQQGKPHLSGQNPTWSTESRRNPLRENQS
ncbi:MAG: hypothetical protein Q7T97_10190, partial [Burkholderiaceae bacterium]|nr:hypothetical protein [Burkholderiaceae bacterium]